MIRELAHSWIVHLQLPAKGGGQAVTRVAIPLRGRLALRVLAPPSEYHALRLGVSVGGEIVVSDQVRIGWLAAPSAVPVGVLSANDVVEFTVYDDAPRDAHAARCGLEDPPLRVLCALTPEPPPERRRLRDRFVAALAAHLRESRP